MIIIGELINASRKKMRAAMEQRDHKTLAKVALDQAEAGADYIDVNAGEFTGREAEYLTWLVEVVQGVTDKPCCLDSPDPAAIQAALATHKGTPMINSISLEKERFEKMISLLPGADMKVIALCMSDQGMPVTTDQRLEIADKLINELVKVNVKIENIFVDPLVQPLSVATNYGLYFLEAVEQLMSRFPGIHTACGLSNISYGLPNRALINQTFMAMAIAKGLDGAIVDPLNKQMMDVIYSAEALANRDEYCLKYLSYYRAHKSE